MTPEQQLTKPLYKVISAKLESQDGGNFDWSDYLPTEDGKPGQWLPERDVSFCQSGWHVTPYPCMWLKEGSRIFEVETKGDGVHDCTGTLEKVAYPSIRLVRELTNYKADGDMNSGNMNSGDRNSGYRNSGNRNSGDMNSGYRNSGYRNSGNWNACNGESGHLNTQQPDTIRVFNRPCDRAIWDAAEIPLFFYDVDGSKESWQEAWESASEREREMVRELPNFDAAVWFELTGIKVEANA